MKKIKNFLFLILSILLITGCGGTKKPSEILTNASKKMKELENYQMIMDADMSFEYEGNTLTMKLSSDSTIDNKNKTVYAKTTVSFLGIASSIKSYQDLSGENAITYTYDNESWTKKTSKIEETEVFDLFNKDREYTETTKTVGDKAYKVILTQEEIKTLLQNSEVTNKEDINAVKNVELTIEVKDEYIKLMTFEMPFTENDMDAVAKINITFDKYNKADSVVIPSDVINSAVTSVD